jgi:NAD-dependent deacetylase
MNVSYLTPTAVERLQNSATVVVFTGAGVSAESGIPTFREAQTGLWSQYDPTELATPGAFRRNPKLVWDFYAHRRDMLAKASPNPGHYAMAEMQTHLPNTHIITQNIDGLHQEAGGKRVIELHGNLSRTKCFEHGHPAREWQTPDKDEPPRCLQCGSFLRPDVVWFHESLSPDALNMAFHLAEQADVFFTIGTSALVHPAATLPLVAAEHGAYTIEINPEPSAVSRYMDEGIRGKSGEVFPQIITQLWGK